MENIHLIAPTNSAVDVLRSEGFGSAQTVAKFLIDPQQLPPDGSYLIVDESGLNSVRQGHDMMQLAIKRNYRILFVGDAKQHSSVEAGDFFAGCMAREFEPDDPNFTPRISAIVHPDGSFDLSILKHQASGRCLREFFCYEGADEGQGFFISTYEGDGNPLPTFSGEPVEVAMCEPDEVWAALDADNKVSLYANVNGEVTLYNKHLGD